MKYLLLAIIVLTFSTSFAHPPSKIQINSSLEEKTISIEVEHKVRGKDHFINFLEVLLNGKSIIKQNCSEQLTDEIQKFVYLIPELKEGDRVTIIAKCNKFGDLKREFSVK